jgi:hypothetical protein
MKNRNKLIAYINYIDENIEDTPLDEFKKN